MESDHFVWDDEKASGNLAKHGISFDDAARAFDDFEPIEDADPHSLEDRSRLIAMVEGRVLFVVFVELPDGRKRLISARRANKNEQDRYFSENR